MKRWIHAATSNKVNCSVNIGDDVTVYEGKVGYANYDGVLVDTKVNKYGVEIGVVDTGNRIKEVPMSSVVPSEKKYFYSLKLSDVLTKEFISQMTHKDDSIWCSKIRYSRVDRDTNMENVVGSQADIQAVKPGEQDYRVIIMTYISKHGSVDRDVVDE